MLDINKINDEFEQVVELLNRRQKNYKNELLKILELNKKRKEIIKEVEELKFEKNKFSKEIGILSREGQKEEITKIKKEIDKITNVIENLDLELKSVVELINEKMLLIPNIPNPDMPIGNDDEGNIEIRSWKNGTLKTKNPAHWEIANKLNLVDFELGAKISGSRFVVYKEDGAKMVRAIADILLKRHTQHGYREMFLPLLVNKENMIGTGQLPKFKEDAYEVDGQYLIPTSEVPLTNIVRNEILDEKELPLKLTSFTQCFRKEAGSAGRDTKGLIRLHQFNKVEMVKICTPDQSEEEFQKMVLDAEDCLKIFNLPYKVVELCTGDVGFSSQKTYDLEVWFPHQNKYREISSCSNCGDFQARRMATKVRKKDNKKSEYVHTLNGSGLAIDRLFAAILENNFDGKKLMLPEVLKPYFDNAEYLI